MNNPQLQSKFLSYLRQEARKNIDTILIWQFICSILLFILGLIVSSNDFGQSLIQTALIIFPAALVNLIPSIILKYISPILNEKAVETVTPLYMITMLVTILFINLGFFFEEVTGGMRQTQFIAFYIAYVIANCFMSVSYLPHLICRVLSIMTFSVKIFFTRRHHGDDSDPTSLILGCFVIFILEVSLRNNIFSKGKLFTENKVNLRQQEQLANLLNSVPDNVLICKKSSANKAPVCVYGNSRINSFFGQSVIEHRYDAANPNVKINKKLRKVNSPYTKDLQQRLENLNPLRRKVFRDFEAYQDNEDRQ